MSTMLADVINAGTAAGARSLGFKLPAAGKTGTTNDFNDAWFIGFTPSLVTGVWVGFDQPQTILPNGFAADVAVPFWAKFMKVATANDKPEWFKPPYGVTTAIVCRLSGKLASEECNHVEAVGKDGQIETRSMVYTEYFSAARSRPSIAICTRGGASGPGRSLAEPPPAQNGNAPTPVAPDQRRRRPVQPAGSTAPPIRRKRPGKASTSVRFRQRPARDPSEKVVSGGASSSGAGTRGRTSVIRFAETGFRSFEEACPHTPCHFET